MNLRINRSIAEQTKVSYAIESAGPLPYDIDCGEGINTVMVPPAAKAAFKELDFEMMRPYPHSVDVKDSIIQYWKGYCPLNYKRIVLCDGSVSGLYLINRLFLERGDAVLGIAPQFSEYVTDAKMYGTHFTGVPLKKENNYRFSVEDLLAALTPDHKLIYIDNPNNPTGQAIPLADIETILAAANKNGTAVVIDEAYGEYIPKKNSAVSLLDKYENLIVARTFSKGFGLAGLRAGYLLIPECLAPYIANITNPYCMTEFARSVAAKTILDESFLEILQSKTAEMKKQMYRSWKNLSIAHTCDTVSISMVTHQNPEIDLAAEFAKRRILVISGNDFENIGQNSVRLRVPEEKDMPAVLKAMEEIDQL